MFGSWAVGPLVLIFLVILVRGRSTGRQELIVLSVFAFVNWLFYLVPPQSCEIEGVGKVSDIAFVVAPAVLFGIPGLRRRLRDVARTPIGKWISLLLPIVILSSILTYQRYHESWFFMFKVVRDYFVYFLFYLFGAILFQQSNRASVFRLMSWFFVLLSSLYILQTFLPPEILLYSSDVTTEPGAHSFEGFVQFRLYLGYLDHYAAMGLLCAIPLVAAGVRKRSTLVFASGLFVFQILLTQHRSLWLATSFGVVAELFFLGQLVNVRRLVVRASVGLVVISILVFQIGLGPLVVERLAAGLEDTPLTGGTMTGRLIASSEYLNMLQDNWILGVGLLHFQSGALGSEDARLYTSELGSLEIVFRLGILGGVWLIGLVVVCLYRVRVLLRMAKARVEDRVVAIGGVSMMIGTLFASFVNGGLTLPGGIVLFVLFMGSLEGSILSVQQESLNRETT